MDKCSDQQSGQAIMEFVLSLMVTLSFFFFFLKLSLMFAVGNYFHYATFMGARTYSSAAEFLGAAAALRSGCVLTDVQIGEHAYLKPYTVASQSSIGREAQLGPFTHLRPRTVISKRAQVGNFVETKNTHLGESSKANHLSYLGDGDIGDGVNIGAGTIFCNYDGVQKHRTVLEDGVFIGSDSQLVAPVRVGKNAYVGTGTTVTMDVPDDALAIGRARQQNKPEYAKGLRKRLAAGKKNA